jgi:hypothetical protein
MAVELAEDFGARPQGIACPLAVFAHPWLDKHVAVARVFDLPRDASASLAFHFLVLSEADYGDYFHNPFAIARRHALSGYEEGMLPELQWPVTPPGPRQVWQVQEVLQRLKASHVSEGVIKASHPLQETSGEPGEIPERTPENSLSPALLGGTQVLVDGGKLYFRRETPDPELIESLWMLLPLRARGKLWPASFAFSTALQFDVVVVPRPGDVDLEGYTSEEQAADYPEGRYELALQIAAESGDQEELNRLFQRRTQEDTLRLALKIMVGMLLIAAGFKCATSRGAEPPAAPIQVMQ